MLKTSLASTFCPVRFVLLSPVNFSISIAMKLKLAVLISILSIIACNDDESRKESCNCGDGTNATSFIVGAGKLYIPNIFTPNADGLNDVFYPHAIQGIERLIDFTVKDKDGTLLASYQLFEPNDPVLSWPDSSTTYYEGEISWVVTAQDTNGVVTTLSGTACCLPFSNSEIPTNWVGCENCRFATQYDGLGGFDENLPSLEAICQ
jgi:hypothetical protein